MDFGAIIFPTEYSISPIEVAQEVEARGFRSLYFPEHTHIPAARTTPYPGGGDLPLEYYSTYDPFVALSFAAAATKNLIVGTGITLVVERDPIVLAKEIASLDRLSNGRFEFGVGAGWNREEMENHGTDPKTRFSLLRERILAMKEIWANKEASFSGKFVNFDRIISDPKPITKPHPPILVGGNGESAFERCLDYGDVWMPIVRANADDFSQRLTEFDAYCLDRGVKRPPVYIFGAPVDGKSLVRYAELGVERAIFWLPSDSREKALSKLDHIQKTISEFNLG